MKKSTEESSAVQQPQAGKMHEIDLESLLMGYPVISFHGQIVPISSQIVPQNSQFVPQNSHFVPHTLYLFSKCVNVIRVQTSDRNMDESIFRTIYIMLRAPYVCFKFHCALRNDVRTIHTMARAYVCRINLFVDF